MDSETKDSKKEQIWNYSYMVKAVSILLCEIISENKTNVSGKDSKEKAPERKNIFTSKKPPSITIQAYLERIIKYSKIEESTLIITLILIDRLCESSHIQLNEFNIHRIILAISILAIKYNEDDYFSNEFYAKVGGISMKEVNQLEFEALILLNHKLFVDSEFFSKYKVYLKHYLK